MNKKEIALSWEDPDRLLRFKLGREEYIQRMLTSLVLGGAYPKWNSRNPPSSTGEKFLQALHRETYACELEGPMVFIDEFELKAENEEGANGAPDYAVLTPTALWIIELKTEAGSHRKGQLPLYAKLASYHYPERDIAITYLTGLMERIETNPSIELPFKHIFWHEIAHLIGRYWDNSPYNEERLLAAAIKREIGSLDTPAQVFREGRDVIGDAVEIATRVQETGEQAAVETKPDGLQELNDLRLRIRDALARSIDLRNVRPWIWCADTSGGSALTHLGREVGYEIRLSRYKRTLGYSMDESKL